MDAKHARRLALVEAGGEPAGTGTPAARDHDREHDHDRSPARLPVSTLQHAAGISPHPKPNNVGGSEIPLDAYAYAAGSIFYVYVRKCLMVSSLMF